MRRLAIVSVLFAVGCGARKPAHDVTQDPSAARQAQEQADKDLSLARKQLADQKGQLAELQSQLETLKARPEPVCEPTKAPDTEELEELRKQKEAAEARARLFDDLMAKLKKMIDAGQLAVTVRHGQIVIELGTDVLFDEGKTDLKPEGKQALVEIAKVLRAVGGRRFQVSGHTDNLPIVTKTYASNWELSTERAVVVVKLLLKDGVRATGLSAAGYADVDPVASNATPQGRAKNRRIEIVLVPNIEELGIQLKGLRSAATDKKPEPKKVSPEPAEGHKVDPKKK